MLVNESPKAGNERESQVTFAVDALRGIVFTNGGAVIALLTFIGQAWGKGEAQAFILIEAIRTGMLLFLAGTTCGITAQGLAYVAQLSFGYGMRGRGLVIRGACLALGLAGICLFMYGAISTLNGVLSLRLKGA